MTKCFTTLEVERYKLGTLMAKYILSKSTTLQNRFLIVGDSKIISKPENQKMIRNSINIPQGPVTANTAVTAVYSSHEVEYGSINCDIYINSKEKKKPTRFYYITSNSLNHIEVESLITDIDNLGQKTGKFKITSGKICFHALGNTENKNSGYIGKSSKMSDKKVEANLRKEFKKWNNSFTFDVSNGTYEVFQHDFHYEEFDFEHHDTMFCIKKLL